MNDAGVAAVVLVSAYALVAPYAWLRAGARHTTTGAAGAVAAYVFLGIPAAWPVALLAGPIMGAASLLSTKSTGGARWLIVQVAAVAVLAGLGYAGVPLFQRVFESGSVRLWPDAWYGFVLVVAGGVVSIEWACPWVERMIRPFAEAMPEGDERNEGLPSGGRLIGRLERLLIYVFVLIGAPTAIGFLVTAKSILRFGEVKDRETRRTAEYIIIGTLLSFSFAIIVAYAATGILEGRWGPD